MTSLFLSKSDRQKGFGMMGAILVILVTSISILGVIQLVSPGLMTRNGRLTMDRMDLISSAVVSYKTHHGGSSRPTLLDHLVSTDGGAACAMDNTPASATYKKLQGWCGPYLDVVFQENGSEYKTDGWGTEFTWDSSTGTLTSCGANRSCGDSDDIVETI